MGNSAAYLKEVFQRTEHSTSELESAKCAPVQKLIDPRSPTDQFSRTPIEVVGLPIKSKSRIRLAHLMESHSPTVTGSYRNSDDTVDSPEVEKTTRRLCRLRLLSDDPRSPSAGIVRTPIQIEATPVDIHHKTNQKEFSPTDSLVTATSLEDVNFSPDVSPATSGKKSRLSLHDPQSPLEGSSHTSVQLDGLSNSLDHQIVDACATLQSVGGSESNRNKEGLGDTISHQLQSRKPAAGRVTPVKWNKTSTDCFIRKLFGTPDSEEHLMQVPLKARTPLQTVSANGISPQQILRVKQSRGINHEVGRLSGIENTPPDTLNKCDLLTKNKLLPKYMPSDWDQDSTIII